MVPRIRRATERSQAAVGGWARCWSGPSAGCGRSRPRRRGGGDRRRRRCGPPGVAARRRGGRLDGPDGGFRRACGPGVVPGRPGRRWHPGGHRRVAGVVADRVPALPVPALRPDQLAGQRRRPSFRPGSPPWSGSARWRNCPPRLQPRATARGADPRAWRPRLWFSNVWFRYRPTKDSHWVHRDLTFQLPPAA